MVRRVTPQVALLLVLALSATTTAACTKDDKDDAKTATVDSGGGRIGPGGALGQIDVPAGAVGEKTEVKFGGGTPPSPAATTEAARPIGEPVAITPAKPLPGAQVRLPLDPERDLPAAGGNKATTANAYIAVFNEALGGWIPLPTAYDPATKQLVATAPHFSWFERFVVDPAKKIWSATKTGVAAAWDVAWDVARGAGSALREMFDGSQSEIDCAGRNADWAVSSEASELTGCVLPGDAGAGRIRLRSTVRIPFDVVLPGAVRPLTGPYQDDLRTIDFLAHHLVGTIPQGYVPVRGRTELALDAATLKAGRPVTVRLQPDLLAMAMSAVWTMLGVVPGSSKALEQVFTRTTVRAQITEPAAGRVTTTTFFSEVRTIVQREIEVEQFSKTANVALVLLHGAECVESAVKDGQAAGEKKSVTDTVKAAFGIAKKCLDTAVTAYEKATGQVISDLVGLFAAVPDVWQLLVSLVDAGKFGIAHFGGTFEVRIEPDTAWLKPYLGDFGAHGWGFAIKSNGTGLLTYRTYIDCANPEDVANHPGVPCEGPYADAAGRAEFTVVRKNGGVYAHITKSNDKSMSGDQALHIERPGVVKFGRYGLACTAAVPNDVQFKLCP